jgi:hypothetical protein
MEEEHEGNPLTLSVTLGEVVDSIEFTVLVG